MKSRVLLLRSGDVSADNPFGQGASCPWETALRAAGFEVATRPALDFEYEAPETLRRLANRLDQCAGWIFTSSRAVAAFGKAVAANAVQRNAWSAKKVFAVGPRTAAALRSLGYEPEGEASGSAEQLARYILKQAMGGPLLFLCGDRRRDTLPAILREGGIATEEIVIYRTRLRTLRAWPGHKKPDWVVFFSPSGFEALLQSPGLSLKGLAIAAIGSATAEVVRAEGFAVQAVAEEPAPEALAQALRKAD